MTNKKTEVVTIDEATAGGQWGRHQLYTLVRNGRLAVHYIAGSPTMRFFKSDLKALKKTKSKGAK